MKWFKSIISFLPLFIFSAYIPLSSIQIKLSDPNSNLNQTVSKFENVLKLTKLQYKITEISQPKKEIVVELPQTTVYFSLLSDPYNQVADLQNTLKNANIKGKHVQIIDLNTSHPYATLTDR